MADPIADIARARRAVSAVSVAFLSSDLDLAMTMVQIARLEPEGSNKRTRNQASARKAYDTVQHLKELLIRSAAEERLLLRKLDELKSALVQMGESF
jgi:hypothetical protein